VSVYKDEFNLHYADWVKSVQNKPDICGIPSFDNDLLPLWDLIAEVNPSKATEVETEFENIVANQGRALEGYMYNPQVTHAYVTTVDAHVADSNNTTVPSGMTHLVKADQYDPANTNVLNVRHFPHFNGPDFENVQISYKTATKTNNNHRNAIAEIGLLFSVDTRPIPPTGWKFINYDFGDTGGPYKRTYLYLICRPVNQKDTRAVDFIGSYQAATEGSGYINDGYKWVPLYEYKYDETSSRDERYDLAIGDFDNFVFLTVHYTPFEW
jgi:hypothetical protein